MSINSGRTGSHKLLKAVLPVFGGGRTAGAAGLRFWIEHFETGGRPTNVVFTAIVDAYFARLRSEFARRKISALFASGKSVP